MGGESICVCCYSNSTKIIDKNKCRFLFSGLGVRHEAYTINPTCVCLAGNYEP